MSVITRLREGSFRWVMKVFLAECGAWFGSGCAARGSLVRIEKKLRVPANVGPDPADSRAPPQTVKMISAAVQVVLYGLFAQINAEYIQGLSTFTTRVSIYLRRPYSACFAPHITICPTDTHNE